MTERNDTPITCMNEQTRDHLADWLIRFRGESRSAYRRDVRQFTAWLGRDPTTARRADVQRWISHLSESGLSDPTVRRKASSLSSFFTYLAEEKVIDHNPAALVRRPQGETATRLGLTADEARRVIEAAQQHSRMATALIALQLGVGLRITEACTAKIADLDRSAGHLTVTVKRGHRRVKPLPPWVLEAVTATIGDRTEGPILLTGSGRPVSRIRGWEFVKTLVETAGIDRPVTDHELRHTCATLALDAGASLEDVSALLGHKSLDTTARYIRGRDEIAGMRKAAAALARILLGEGETE